MFSFILTNLKQKKAQKIIFELLKTFLLLLSKTNTIVWKKSITWQNKKIYIWGFLLQENRKKHTDAKNNE